MEILLATTNPHKLEEIRSVIDEPSLSFMLLSQVDPEGRVGEPVEDQATFEANALLKARYYAEAFDMLTLADDSGLEVDALDGQPGVRSARFSGVQGTRDEIDAANNLLLLKKLDKHPVEQRTARFVCALALTKPGLEPAHDHAHEHTDGRDHEHSPNSQETGSHPPSSDDSSSGPASVYPIIVRGSVAGRILTRSEASDDRAPERGRGDNGFGYDPLFELPADHPDHPSKTTAELTAAQKNALSHRGRAARKLWSHLESVRVWQESGAIR